jgi:pyruvate,water dikinase
VRSSATAEDLPDASFAGQQETFLNVRGIDAVLQAVREVYASLYNDRAIAYRVHHGFEHETVSLSAGVQRMVRSDVGASGVLFTMDTESGFRDAVFVTAAYGLGEGVVQGAVNPDEFYVYKPALRAGRPAILKRGVGEKATKMVYTEHAEVGRTTEFVDVDPADRRLLSLTDDEVLELARQALRIEEHYGRPMDIEWGKDGLTGKIYVLQARPETVQSRSGNTSERYKLTGTGEVVVEGRAIGQKIGSGAVRVLTDIDQMDEFVPGDVLVADMTDPDWEPIMKRAAAIVTNRGGRTCHAAIIARELGIPAVVGTGTATRVLSDGDPVTVSCAEGDTGLVYAGEVGFEVSETELDAMPEIPTKIMMNVGTPEQAFAFSRLPHAGVGLARLEFIINRQIGIHPRALLDLDQLDAPLKREIEERIAAYPSARDFFVQRVAEGISMIAAAFAPEPVIVRMSDFKSNEYANLLGGEAYEPHEENPMLGYRDDMGLTNVKIMIPFVRTVAEIEGVVRLLGEHGLRRGENDLSVVMMCELPSNALLAGDFLEHVDGFSIGSNDMTQLTLGLDRDSALVAGGLRRAGPGGPRPARDGHPGLPGAGEVRRHLRPGPQRPPRPGRVARGAGHRVDVAEPGHRRRHLAAPGEVRPRDLRSRRVPGRGRTRLHDGPTGGVHRRRGGGHDQRGGGAAARLAVRAAGRAVRAGTGPPGRAAAPARGQGRSQRSAARTSPPGRAGSAPGGVRRAPRPRSRRAGRHRPRHPDPPLRRHRLGRLPLPLRVHHRRLRADHRPGAPAATGAPGVRSPELRDLQLRAPQGRPPPPGGPGALLPLQRRLRGDHVLRRRGLRGPQGLRHRAGLDPGPPRRALPRPPARRHRELPGRRALRGDRYAWSWSWSWSWSSGRRATWNDQAGDR